MRFKLTLEMDNAAFADAPGEELQRILSNLHLQNRATADNEGTVKDYNGNTIGSWEVSA